MPLKRLANRQRNSAWSKPGNYRTSLSPNEEMTFRKWVINNKIPFEPDDSFSDYDMRGYWKAANTDPMLGTSINPNDGLPHFPDTYKTPYHDTFSNESMYAQPWAPKWQGDRLVDALGGLVKDESKQP